MSQNALQKRPHSIPSLIAAVMLFGALADPPYGYYQLLRFVVCGVSLYIAYTAYTWQKIWAVWLFGFIAILFNPFVPLHFSKELWQSVDVICALLFVVLAFVLEKPAEEKHDKNLGESEKNSNEEIISAYNRIKEAVPSYDEPNYTLAKKVFLEFSDLRC